MHSSNAFVGTLLKGWNNITEYHNLRAINDSLSEENNRLKNIVEKYRADNIPPIESFGFNYSSAKVVGNTTKFRMNFLTISKGSRHGIAPDMGVIGHNGIVGIVYSCSDKYSSVISILNTDVKTSVRLQKSKYFGSLSWNGEDVRVATLSEIPGYVEVEVGDVVVTSGLSSMFPADIPVGTVRKFDKDLSTGFYTIDVELFTDFNSISYVYVIKNLNYEEQEKHNKRE